MADDRDDAEGDARRQPTYDGTNSRCQRKMVSGLTKKEAQTGRGSLRAEPGQQQAIARLPARAAGLTLEDAKLMAEKEYLGLEAGLGATADEEEIEEQTEQAAELGQEHGLASSQARLLAQISW